MADERRPSPPARGPRNRPAGGRAPSAPLTGPLVVDAATDDALRLFNARLGAQAENEKAERRVQKAAKAKDDAAGRVRSLENDTKATAEQRAEAAAAYRTAVDAWERARKGEPDPAPARAEAPADAVADEATTEDAPADEATTEDAPADAPLVEDAAVEDAAVEDAPAEDPPTVAAAPPDDAAADEPAADEPPTEA